MKPERLVMGLDIGSARMSVLDGDRFVPASTDRLVAGASAYPRAIDFARLAEIAHGYGAMLMVDMAHIAGLVAGGAPVAHV